MFAREETELKGKCVCWGLVSPEDSHTFGDPMSNCGSGMECVGLSQNKPKGVFLTVSKK